mgnify:CR=1 FL=1
MKFLVIGGVAAGTKTAAKLKRMNPEADVTVLTKGKDISYAGCGLPYYISGVIESKEQLIVNTPAKFTALTGAKVLTEREAISLLPQNKQVIAKNLRTGMEETYEYDECVIATGASAIVPPIQGVSLPGVFTMRTPQDAIELKEYLRQNEVKTAVVAGGGFIGLEAAENLASLGISVTVIDMAEQIMPGFDIELANYAKRHLEKKGIRVLLKTKLEAITGEWKAQGVLAQGQQLKADVVVLSLGIRPNTAFLKDSGIELLPNGTIAADAQMKTNLPYVSAAGDCVSVFNRITGKREWSPMGSSANMEGRTLAERLGQKEGSYPGVLGTAVVKLPELNCGRTGLSEQTAKAQGFDVISAVATLDDKAHYYPDSSTFIIKLVADRTTAKLLGVQVLGSGAVDKVVDAAVVALTMQATVFQLQNMDMAYAPPFSTAIHPLVTAVNVLINKMEGRMDSMTPAEFMQGQAEDYRFIDTARVPSIQGAPYVDPTTVTGELQGIAKDEKLLLICNRGKRAYLLQNRLRAYGYTNTKVLEGGLAVNQMPAQTGKVTVSAEDIKRVKAWGFLHNKGTDCFNARIITRNGKITAEENRAITEAAQKFGNGEIAMTSRLTVEIQGVPYSNIEPLRSFVAEYGLETGGTGSKVRPVVSCKGTTCQYGLIDTFDLSNKIHDRFFKGYSDVKLPHKFKIAVGGCPNNCVKPNLNDLGIVGQRVPGFREELCRGCKVCQVEKTCPVHAAKLEGGVLKIDKDICNNCGRCIQSCPFKAMPDGLSGYRVYIGGRWGKKFAHGRPLEPVFTSEEEVMQIIEKAILLFREQGKTGERFSDTIERLGFENVQQQLLSDELLQRKEQIIGASLHLVGGATC